jgi:antitoxin (DNA-binding transcriptional repressor) of toxin-antitoxin stability system
MEATMHEAKTSLSKLVARAIAGEEVILTNGKTRTPVARIVAMNPCEKTADSQIKGRPIGLFKGQFEVPDSFFDPLSEEELALWEAPIVSTWADNDGNPKETE